MDPQRKHLKRLYTAHVANQDQQRADARAKREQQAWEVVDGYLSSATPEQLHFFAAKSNYDGSLKAITALLDNPRLDQGTALLVFWRLGADYLCRFSDGELPESSMEADLLAAKIQLRLLEGFYCARSLAHDPYADCMHPGEYEFIGPAKRTFAAVMYQAIEGAKLKFEDFDSYHDGLPAAVAAKVLSALHEDGVA